MKFGFAAAAGLAVLSAGAARAQDETDYGSVYARIGAGLSFANDWEQEFAYNPDVAFSGTPATGQTLDLEKGLVASAALGFDYADGIRTELEYRYAQHDVDMRASVGPAGAALPASVNDEVVGHFLMANFYFDFANSSPFTPYIGGGVGGAFMENETAERDAALALQGRAGLSLAMGAGFSTDLEYVYLRTNELEFGPSAAEFEPGGPLGPAITGERYNASSVIVSIRKAF